MQKTEVLLLLCALLKPSSRSEIETLKEKISNKQIPWVEIVEIANRNYLIPVLYAELQDKQLLELLPDKQLQEYLYAIYTFNSERNEQIIEQLKDIVSILKPFHITPLFLKGSASLSEKDYSSIGMRSLTDVDILIKEDELNQAFDELIKSGYSFVREEDERTLTKDFHHIEPISKEGMPTSVELHRTVLGKKATGYMLDFSEHITKSSHPDFLDVDIFTPTYRLYHAFLHTELQDDDHKFKRLALRHLFDFTILVHTYYQHIDWKLLEQLVIEINCKEILDDYLYMAKIFFSLETPLTIENTRTKQHYNMILKAFELQDTKMGKFYPLSAQIPQLLARYSYKRLQKIYSFESYAGYVVAIFKYFYRHLLTLF